jgi:hypothetical protein
MKSMKGITSKLFGWLREVEIQRAAVIFYAVLVAGCGGTDSPVNDGHWASQYRGFGGNKPDAGVDQNWKVFLDRPVLGKVEIKTPSVGTAISELNEAIRKAGATIDLDVTRIEPQDERYKTAIAIDLENQTVAGAIDEIVRQAGLVWDFQGQVLVIRPKPE